MGDPEAEAWRSGWTGTEVPLPDIRARVTAQVARHRRANILFFALNAGGVIANLLGQDDPIVRWLIIAWSVVLSVGLLWIQRGIACPPSGSPREALAYLERRIRMGRQGAHLARWMYPPLMIFVAIYYRDLFGEDAIVVKLVLRAMFGALVVGMISAPWWVRRLTAAQQAEINAWRKWLDEQPVGT